MRETSETRLFYAPNIVTPKDVVTPSLVTPNIITPKKVNHKTDDTIKVLYSICQQILKIQQWPQHRKMSVSVQSQRRAMPKNVQTTVQLHSFHMIARLYSKSFKLGFSSM